MSEKKRLFLILLLAGLTGILSFLFVDLSAIIAAVPQPPGQAPVDLPPPALLKVISLIQPTVLLAIAVLIGVGLADRVGLHSPAAEAWAQHNAILPSLRPQIVPGIVAGLATGLAIVVIWVVAKPFLSNEFITRAMEFNKLLPNATRFLYGGFVEELLLRWGLMTFLVWVCWRLFQNGKGVPKSAYFITAILVSAVAFGLGHLPIAFLLNGERLDLPLTVYVIAANSIFGIAAGFLYWRRGLESAMIAHMCVHVVLILAIALSF